MGKLKVKDEEKIQARASRLPDPTQVLEGELTKSRQTRTRIMEAAITCLAEHGYAGTTTTSVATGAGLTRAAMLYHFPSRMALIEATINYVTRKRLQMYTEATAGNPLDHAFFPRAIELMWEQLMTKEFRAFCELATAARTDPELSTVFTPALLEFDRARRETALALFPKDVIDAPWFDLRRDLARFLLEGLAQQNVLAFDGGKRTAEILGFMKALAQEPEGEALLEKAQKKWATQSPNLKGRSLPKRK